MQNVGTLHTKCLLEVAKMALKTFYRRKRYVFIIHVLSVIDETSAKLILWFKGRLGVCSC